MKSLKRFTAAWCAPCKELQKTLESMNLDIPIDVIDIEKDFEETVKYKVRSVPTLILFEDDVELKRMSGPATEAKLLEWIK